MRRLIPSILLSLIVAACGSPGPPEIIDLPTVAILPTQPPTDTPTATLTPTATFTPSNTPTGTLPPTATVTVTPSATITDTVTPTPSDTMTPTETLPALEGLGGLGFLAARATVIPDFLTPGTPPARSRVEIPRVVTARPRAVAGAVTATPLGGVPGAAIPTFGAPVSGATPTPLGGVAGGDDCRNPAPGGFGAAVANNPLIAVTLGCPVGTPETRASAYQPYQNGFMVWVSSPDGAGNIYVFDNTNGTVQIFPDTWQSGVDPERGGDAPPDGLTEPIRGFGKVWREQPGVRDALGWATNAEQGAEASLLAFDTGRLLALRQTNQIIAVGNDGLWSAAFGNP